MPVRCSPPLCEDDDEEDDDEEEDDEEEDDCLECKGGGVKDML